MGVISAIPAHREGTPNTMAYNLTLQKNFSSRADENLLSVLIF
jgi:hypothetical protein